MKGLLRLLLWVGIIGGIAFVVGWLFFFESFEVRDNSMVPNLVKGDKILVFIRGSLKRGYAAVCAHPETGEKIIGRIIGEPGQNVKLHRQGIYVRSRLLKNTSEGPYIHVEDNDEGEQLTYQFQLAEEEAGMVAYMVVWPDGTKVNNMREIIVPQEHFFLFADNRALGTDSRDYGFVSISSCTGRPFMVYNPAPTAGDAQRALRFFSMVD